jgi:hypothetical protein
LTVAADLLEAGAAGAAAAEEAVNVAAAAAVADLEKQSLPQTRRRGEKPPEKVVALAGVAAAEAHVAAAVGLPKEVIEESLEMKAPATLKADPVNLYQPTNFQSRRAGRAKTFFSFCQLTVGLLVTALQTD